MDFASLLSKSEPHHRTIIHLDMDCFYAQVEEVRNPTLRHRPLGVQQKNFVVTCNYRARQYGVTKLMLVAEAQRLCPELVLVPGEDLTPYRQMSQRIFELLLNYTPNVEKLGFDENFMDVTSLVATRLEQLAATRNGCPAGRTTQLPPVIGHVHPADGTPLTDCDCGCAVRLALGTQLAQEIRDDLRTTLNMTCCAGVAHNKLLAKLVGAVNKPNQQTVLVSSCTEQFMRQLRDLHRVTGIGQRTESLLLENGIATIEELQNCELDVLRKKLGFETATKLRELSYGRDSGAVRPTGKPKSIGLEDSCRPISVRAEVEERFRLLLMRLLEQVAEDGRIPITVKVVLRKFDPHKKTSHRETKQANVLPSLFKATCCNDTGSPKVMLAEGAQEKLLKIVMRLFERVVDLAKPFNITLIGLAFSKFQQRRVGSSSIANYLIKKTDLEVQSITSLTNTSVYGDCVGGSGALGSPTPSVSSVNSDEGFRSSPTTFQPSDQFSRRRNTTASPIPMLVDNGSESGATNSDFSDFSETEIEPSPKKSRIGRMLLAKRRCFGGVGVGLGGAESGADVASPSKLRVCDLRLNSRDSEIEFPLSQGATTTTVQTTSTSAATPTAGTGCAAFMRFRTIHPPSSLVQRPAENGRPTKTTTSTRLFALGGGSPLASPMDDSNSTTPPATPTTGAAPCTPMQIVELPSSDAATATSCVRSLSPGQTLATATVTSGALANIPCPAGVDPEVFNALPVDVQNELIGTWRRSLAAAAVAVANGKVSTLSDAQGSGGGGAATAAMKTNSAANGGGGVNGAQKNTLYRYFLRNK